MSDRDLFNEFEFQGIWWLPQTPKKPVTGKVTFDPEEGVHLSILGNLGFEPHPGMIAEDDYNFVHGETKEGLQVTLYKCRMKERNGAGSRGIDQNIYRADVMLVGRLFSSEEEFYFSSLSLTFSGLEYWLQQSPFLFPKSNIENAGQKDGDDITTIKYQSIEHFSFPVPSLNATFKSSNQTVRSFSHESGWAQTILATPYLSLEFSKKRSLDEIHDIIVRIENLFCLFMGQPISSRLIYLDRDVIDAERREVTQNKVDLVFSSRGQKKQAKLRRHDVVLLRPEIGDSALPAVIDRWFEKYETLSPSYNLFFAGFYQPDLYIEFQFLGLAQAVESFHRIARAGKLIGDQEYEVFSQKVRNAIADAPEDLKQSFGEKVKYGNEVTLRRRLRELIASLPIEFSPLLPNNEKPLVDAIVRLRNELTHPGLENPPLNAQKVVNASNALRFLFTSLLLTELRIPPTQAMSAVKRGLAFSLRSRSKRGSLTEIE